MGRSEFLIEREAEKMFCNQCGKEIPDDSNVCMYCGSKVVTIVKNNLDNIAGDDRMDVSSDQIQEEVLTKENEKSAELNQKSWKRPCIFGTELILVRSLALSIICIVISSLLMLDDKYQPTDGIKYSSLILLTLSIIMMALWTSNKRTQGILVGILGGQLVSVPLFYIGYRDLVGSAGFRFNNNSAGVISVFVLVVLLCLWSAVCVCIHFFSKYNLGKVTVILSSCSAVLTFVLAFIMYFWIYVPKDNYFEYVKGAFSENSFTEYMQGRFPQGEFMFHSISMVWLSLIVALYTAEFFRGRIYNEKDKIYIITMNKMKHVASTVMQKVGEKAGTKIDAKTEIKGEDVQCSIQYNRSENTYGITVHSDTTVFVNGGRLPQGVMIEYPAGITLEIGTEKSKIYLE